MIYHYVLQLLEENLGTIVFIAGISLGFFYHLKGEACPPWQPMNSRSRLTLVIPLLCCGCYFSYTLNNNLPSSTPLFYGGIYAFGFTFISFSILYYIRCGQLDPKLAYICKNGIVDAHDLQAIKDDLYNGHVYRVIGILMLDACHHHKMERYHQLYCMRRSFYTHQHFGQDNFIVLQSQSFQQTLLEMLNNDFRNSL